MTAQILYAFITIIVGVGGCFGYFYGSNWLLDRVSPADASNDASAVRNLKLQAMIRPWLFLGPALLSAHRLSHLSRHSNHLAFLPRQGR